MILYPTLEIMNGRCVTLTRGRLNEPVLWHVDPVETARGFAAAGAEWMHLTDLDALRGNNENAELIQRIIREVGIPVQLGGGFRSREAVNRWIDRGAGRIVLGTMAAYDAHAVKELATHHPDQIAVSLDIYQGKLMTDGWRTYTAFGPETLIHAFDGVPLAAIIITDIDADIEDSDGSLGVISGLAAKTRHPVIARGTVRSADDVARLKYIRNIAGAMVSRALLSKDLDLAEALAVARATPEPTAEFI